MRKHWSLRTNTCWFGHVVGGASWAQPGTHTSRWKFNLQVIDQFSFWQEDGGRNMLQMISVSECHVTCTKQCSRVSHHASCAVVWTARSVSVSLTGMFSIIHNDIYPNLSVSVPIKISFMDFFWWSTSYVFLWFFLHALSFYTLEGYIYNPRQERLSFISILHRHVWLRIIFPTEPYSVVQASLILVVTLLL